MSLEHITPLASSIEKIPSAKELSKKDFSFTADDVIREFRQDKIEYIGTATADWQATLVS